MTKKGHKNHRSFLLICERKVLFDTNILMLSDQSKARQRKLLVDFTSQNAVCICDTVFFESLRNMNHEKFRKRKEEIRKMTSEVISETSKEVKAIFERLSIIYMYLYRDNIQGFFHRNIQDLWIIAAALSHGIECILTRDESNDFHSELFVTEKYDLNGGVTVHLKTFNDQRAQEIWEEIKKNGNQITVKLSQGYLNELLKN